MRDLLQKMLDDYKEGPYAFEVGQRTRIRKHLKDYWPGCEIYRGAIGMILDRRTSLFSHNISYMIDIGGKMDWFKEEELDFRTRKRVTSLVQGN